MDDCETGPPVTPVFTKGEDDSLPIEIIEVGGVRLTDLYEDDAGTLWRVVGIATSPTVTVERVNGAAREHHVIDSLRWRDRWARRYRAEEIPGG